MTCLKLNNDYYETSARDKKFNKMRASESRLSSYYACFEQEHVMDPIPVYSNSEVKIKWDFVPGFYYLSSGTGTQAVKTAKWLSRDHIAEQGGYNLYGFIGNDGVNKWDYLGKKINPFAPNGGNGGIFYAWDKDTLRDAGAKVKEIEGGLSFSYLMTTYDIKVKDNGCVYFCVSWTPTELLGASIFVKA